MQMMINSIILLVLNLFVVCGALSQSPLMQFEAKSYDAVSAMKQAALVLNVQVPNDWNNYMDAPASSGSYGQANVGISTIDSTMANWAIPEAFRSQAVQNVRLLVLAATEGTYSAQAFSFDVASKASLTTLLVVAIRMSSPVDPNLPIAIMYVTINTNAPIKQLYSYWTERVCHRCPKCLWGRKCCCHDEPRSAPRGHTPAELYTVLQKMTADQYVWFNQQSFPSSASKILVKLGTPSDNENIGLSDAIENFLSNKTVKAEVLASYNDSVITAVQTNFASLKLSSQTLKLNKVHRQNLPLILKSLAEDYGFDDIYSNANISQQFNSSRFSYENLFTFETGDTENKHLSIKYIWIIGQSVDDLTYAINFLSINITSESLVETMLLNSTTKFISSYMVNKDKRLNIIRTSILGADGAFSNEHFLTSVTAWQLSTTKIVLNMLRFLGGTILVPQKFRMLSQYTPEVVLPNTYRNVLGDSRSSNASITDKIVALASSVSSAVDAARLVIELLKSSKSVTIQQVIRFGFNYFNQKSTILKVIDIPSQYINEFTNAIMMDYDLPSKASFMLGLTYSADFAWEQVEFLYSPAMNGNYRSLTLFKNGDSIKNTASFFIVDIDAKWALAPDLLIVTTSKSTWGGLFSSSKQTMEEVPHVLTIDEAIKLQQFFMLVAIGNMAGSLGVNATLPPLN